MMVVLAWVTLEAAGYQEYADSTSRAFWDQTFPAHA